MTLEAFLSMIVAFSGLLFVVASMRVMRLSRIMAQITGSLKNTRLVSRRQ
jgi:hypothetical protein